MLGMEPVANGKVVKRGKLKLWNGKVPATPWSDAVATDREGPHGSIRVRRIRSGAGGRGSR